MKMCVEPEEGEKGEDMEVEVGEFKAEGVDWSMEYKCSSVMFGDDKFNPPSDIEFMNPGEMMKGFMPEGMK